MYHKLVSFTCVVLAVRKDGGNCMSSERKRGGGRGEGKREGARKVILRKGRERERGARIE